MSMSKPEWSLIPASKNCSTDPGLQADGMHIQLPSSALTLASCPAGTPPYDSVQFLLSTASQLLMLTCLYFGSSAL